MYVRPFPGPGAKRQISTRGGQFPIWSRNAPKLFFLASDWRITVVAYTTKGDSFAAAKPQVWSEKRLPESGVPIYDLAPDGKRFAVVLYSDGTVEQKENLTDSVTVLLNFFDELRRRVPAGGK